MMKKLFAIILAVSVMLTLLAPATFADSKKNDNGKKQVEVQVNQDKTPTISLQKQNEQKLEDLKDQLEAKFKDSKLRQELIKKLAALKKQLKDNNVVIFIDGKEIKLDVKPLVSQNKWESMLIPAKQIAESLGATVTYSANTVTIVKTNTTKGTITIVFTIGSNTAKVTENDGTKVTQATLKLGAYVKKSGNQFMIPFSIIAKVLECKYTIDPSGIVMIEKPVVVSKPESSSMKYVSYNDTTTKAGYTVVTYSGEWGSGSQAGAFNSDNHWSSTTGAAVTIEFKGSAIKVYGAKAPNHGIATFVIDPGTGHSKTFTVDYYAAARSENTLVFQSTTLSEGSHKLSITVKGMKNASSTGNAVTIDRIEVGSISHFNAPTPKPTPKPAKKP